MLADQLVIMAVLRAGLPLAEGLLQLFDQAEMAFIGAFREEEGEEASVQITAGYTAVPSLEGKVLIIADPMLASGSTLLKTLELIAPYGKPKRIISASTIASAAGVAAVQNKLEIFTTAIDPELDQHSYIVPGMGDAGDLAFGPKIHR